MHREAVRSSLGGFEGDWGCPAQSVLLRLTDVERCHFPCRFGVIRAYPCHCSQQLGSAQDMVAAPFVSCDIWAKDHDFPSWHAPAYVCSRWRESKGISPPSHTPTLAGLCLQSLSLEPAALGTGCVLKDICAVVTTVLLFPLWHHVTEVAWPEACVSLATAPGWVGADMLFSVYFSKSSQWDALRAGFSKRVWAVLPRAAGAAARFRESI